MLAATYRHGERPRVQGPADGVLEGEVHGPVAGETLCIPAGDGGAVDEHFRPTGGTGDAALQPGQIRAHLHHAVGSESP